MVGMSRSKTKPQLIKETKGEKEKSKEAKAFPTDVDKNQSTCNITQIIITMPSELRL